MKKITVILLAAMLLLSASCNLLNKPDAEEATVSLENTPMITATPEIAKSIESIEELSSSIKLPEYAKIGIGTKDGEVMSYDMPGYSESYLASFTDVLESDVNAYLSRLGKYQKQEPEKSDIMGNAQYIIYFNWGSMTVTYKPQYSSMSIQWYCV